VFSLAFEFITITTPNNILKPITLLIAGYLTLRIRNGMLESFLMAPTLPIHPAIILILANLLHSMFVLSSHFLLWPGGLNNRSSREG